MLKLILFMAKSIRDLPFARRRELAPGILVPVIFGSVYLPAAHSEDNHQNDEPKARTALVIPVHKELKARTSNGIVVCKPGSLVFFIDTLKEVAYYCVTSKNPGDVKVYVGKYEVGLPTGEELLVTPDSKATFEQLNPGKGISFRKPRLEHEADGLRFFRSDFSIPSAIIAVRPLKAMLKSKDAYKKHLIDDVLKNAVIWQTVTASDGPFVPAK